MKKAKILLLILLQFIGFAAAFAANPSEEDVRRYQASMMSYLKTEGYTPAIDDDGDIEFTQDDELYWVSVCSSHNGYCVTLMTLLSMKQIDEEAGEGDGYDIADIRRAMNVASHYSRFARLYSSKDRKFVVVDYSWYCESLSDFKRMFGTVLFTLNYAKTEFLISLWNWD